jgi:hypothetical protein
MKHKRLRSSTANLGDRKDSMFDSEKDQSNSILNGEVVSDISEEESDALDEDVYDPRISREDLKLHISGTILSLVNVTFENQGIESLK